MRDGPRWSRCRPPHHGAEVCLKRLELAEEMLELVLEDGQDLASAQRRTLQRLTTTLAEMRRQAGEQR